MRKIADAEVGKLIARTKGLGYTLEVSEAARDNIAVRGFDSRMGARPLRRAIEEGIEDPLCELLMDAGDKAPSRLITADYDAAADKYSILWGKPETVQLKQE